MTRTELRSTLEAFYWDIDKLTEGRLAARAALRWWRWKHRGPKWIAICVDSPRGIAVVDADKYRT